MKCAIYCRLSREDGKETESESIKNQKAILLRYARDKGWELYKVYSDEDYSGIGVKRPAFNALLADAEAGCFDVVLCKTQSRFTRDMEQVEKYLHKLFPLWGVRFVAVADHADTAVKGNKKARQIAGLVNEWYLEDLSDNIRAVLDHKRSRGHYIGSFPLYGYRKAEEQGRLEIDEEAAAVVRRIFSMCMDGMSAYAICRCLNEDGIPNPAAYKREKGLAFRPSVGEDFSVKWNKTTVARILANRMYTGVMVQGTRRKISYKCEYVVSVPKDEWFVVDGTHEAIIDRETFELVQEILQVRRMKSGREQGCTAEKT